MRMDFLKNCAPETAPIHLSLTLGVTEPAFSSGIQGEKADYSG
jgi:hypothetical protein